MTKIDELSEMLGKLDERGEMNRKLIVEMNSSLSKSQDISNKKLDSIEDHLATLNGTIVELKRQPSICEGRFSVVENNSKFSRKALSMVSGFWGVIGVILGLLLTKMAGI